MSRLDCRNAGVRAFVLSIFVQSLCILCRIGLRMHREKRLLRVCVAFFSFCWHAASRRLGVQVAPCCCALLWFTACCVQARGARALHMFGTFDLSFLHTADIRGRVLPVSGSTARFAAARVLAVMHDSAATVYRTIPK